VRFNATRPACSDRCCDQVVGDVGDGSRHVGEHIDRD